ncbi:hypothetical protein Acsp06_34220 [Actinomycetospora sp. NBRC 106375]|uniref:tyrosine-type recombinase/integrase n=1 Tax=Actinomycetospora sp. NBRC 106375 TaxID=3032207 RepID=UPI0024A2724B|nr:tyrosine-type recombinase/integrase [Actinomycetospora sp. NBRC 106375]GLZ47237.1 hypothetical protein Acsp06_34220 [Actinomycetospora sp. NBRC 106375]
MLFTGSRGGALRRGDFHRETAWTKTVVKVGLPAGFHFHDLRHTGNQLVAISGASTRELMRHMGHASMRAALIYQHTGDERDRAIADSLSARVERSRPADEDEEGDDAAASSSHAHRTTGVVPVLARCAAVVNSALTCTNGVERATGIEPA